MVALDLDEVKVIFPSGLKLVKKFLTVQNLSERLSPSLGPLVWLLQVNTTDTQEDIEWVLQEVALGG